MSRGYRNKLGDRTTINDVVVARKYEEFSPRHLHALVEVLMLWHSRIIATESGSPVIAD
jgi:hypothetical protein